MNVVTAASVLAAIAVLSPGWRVARGWVTFAHELGHAIMAILAEGRVRRIGIRLDASGETSWEFPGRARRIPHALIVGSGYPAPGAAGAAAAWGVASGHEVVTAYVLAGVVAVVTLVWVRTLWGLAVCAVLAAICAMAAVAGETAATAAVVAVAVTWALGGLRSAVSIAGKTRRGDGSDPATLARLLWLPAKAWAWAMVGAAALGAGATAWLLASVH